MCICTYICSTIFVATILNLRKWQRWITYMYVYLKIWQILAANQDNLFKFCIFRAQVTKSIIMVEIYVPTILVRLRPLEKVVWSYNGVQMIIRIAQGLLHVVFTKYNIKTGRMTQIIQYSQSYNMPTYHRLI